MFCTHCGSQLPETAKFCVHCGGEVKHAAPVAPPVPVQTPQPQAQAPPPPPAPRPVAAPPHQTVPARTGRVTCRWCGAVSDGSVLSCPGCGATLTEMPVVAASGWGQLPGRKDMAKLQFGNSFCQIEGMYVPVADLNLAAGDSVYFAHHVLLWKDAQIQVTTMPMKGAWKRMFAGLPLIMTQAEGPGHIAFSRDAPGEMLALPLQPGHAVDVREHLFMIATGSVAYDWFEPGIYFTTKNGDDTETHYPIGMFMDRFTAPQVPGLLLLHAAGNVFVRQLAPQQSILVKPSALIFKDPSVSMHLHFEHPRFKYGGWGTWSNRYLWLRVRGPGRVALQSVFEPAEGEDRAIYRHSQATSQQW